MGVELYSLLGSSAGNVWWDLLFGWFTAFQGS